MGVACSFADIVDLDQVELGTVFVKLGFKLTPEEDSNFIAADADDNGTLDFKPFGAWISVWVAPVALNGGSLPHWH